MNEVRPDDPTHWDVLVIDDDPLFLEIARVALERVGAKVTTVLDAEEGVSLAIEGSYNLAVLDLMMPGTSGEEVLGLLKPLALRLRVVVVTASTDPESRARTRDLGAAGFVSKPINARDFPAQLASALAGQTDLAESPASIGGWDRVVIWVLGQGPATPLRRAAAAGTLLGLAGVLIALLFV